MTTFQDGLSKWPVYGHDEKTGCGTFCSVKDARFCSKCGAGQSISWILRHDIDNTQAYEWAQAIYTKYMSENWANKNENLPYIEAMVLELKTRHSFK